MTLRIEQGNGSKDRYAMLSPVLLERLRAWWQFAHAQGKCCQVAGYSLAWTPSTRSARGNSTVPSMRPQRRRG